MKMSWVRFPHPAPKPVVVALADLEALQKDRFGLFKIVETH